MASPCRFSSASLCLQSRSLACLHCFALPGPPLTTLLNPLDPPQTHVLLAGARAPPRRAPTTTSSPPALSAASPGTRATSPRPAMARPRPARRTCTRATATPTSAARPRLCAASRPPTWPLIRSRTSTGLAGAHACWGREGRGGERNPQCRPHPLRSPRTRVCSQGEGGWACNAGCSHGAKRSSAAAPSVSMGVVLLPPHALFQVHPWRSQVWQGPYYLGRPQVA
jgi:hypothetical protein